jgi:hypothetical protein
LHGLPILKRKWKLDSKRLQKKWADRRKHTRTNTETAEIHKDKNSHSLTHRQAHKNTHINRQTDKHIKHAHIRTDRQVR